MGGVCEERPLSVDELVQAVCHLVNGLAERLELSRPAPDGCPLRQTACAHRRHGGLDPLEGTGERPGDKCPGGRGHHEHARSEEGQIDPMASDAGVQWRRGLRHEEHDIARVRRGGDAGALHRMGHRQRHVQEVVIWIMRALLARGLASAPPP